MFCAPRNGAGRVATASSLAWICWDARERLMGLNADDLRVGAHHLRLTLYHAIPKPA
jgi:hypothetical protein